MINKSMLYAATFSLLVMGAAFVPAQAQEMKAATMQVAPIQATKNPQTPAVITLKPHNATFDKTLTRHQALILQYIAESGQVNALVQKSLELQHRQTLIERDITMTKRMMEDTRSRKTKADLQASINKWEADLASIGDDAQLANIDLQNALQKQQQTLQTMSNVSKMMHDTAMAVIRKIGG
jgi:hypothetical protein